jgi:hypothetical protein
MFHGHRASLDRNPPIWSLALLQDKNKLSVAKTGLTPIYLTMDFEDITDAIEAPPKNSADYNKLFSRISHQ